MKIWQTIVLCAVSALLTISIFFNIFFVNIFEIHDSDSFKQALLSKEILDEFINIEDTDDNTDTDVEIDSPITTPSTDKEEDNITDNPQTDNNQVIENKPLQKNEIVFDQEDVTITFVKQESGLYGKSFVFLIKNNSDIEVSVSFTDVYLDDLLLEMSGGSTWGVAPGKTATIELSLLEYEYEEFITNPKKVEYAIKLWDADTYEDIVIENKVLYIE
jgi:hypothetical protein